MNALIPLVVTLPLLGAAVTLVAGRRRRVQVAASVVTLSAVLVIAAILLVAVDGADMPLAVSVGGWPIPSGIRAGRHSPVCGRYVATFGPCE